MTMVLNETLLAALEDSWQGQRAEIAHCLRPGLSAEQMQALVEPLGIRLPAEARTWWGWHDGVASRSMRGWEIGPHVGFYSLQQAIEEFQRQREMGEADDWAERWLPLVKFPRGALAIDCGVADGAPVPVYRFDWEIGSTLGAESIGELVATWIEVIQAGAWRWNAVDGHWDRDLDLMPDSVKPAYIA